MLGRMGKKGGGEGREEEVFKDFSSRTEDGDGTIGGGIRSFTRFEERDDDRGIPDGRDVGGLDGEVVEGGEVGDAGGTKVFEVEDGETVRTYGGGVGGFGNCGLD